MILIKAGQFRILFIQHTTISIFTGNLFGRWKRVHLCKEGEGATMKKKKFLRKCSVNSNVWEGGGRVYE